MGLFTLNLWELLKKTEIDIDRKVLAELAVNNSDGFVSIVEKAKAHI